MRVPGFQAFAFKFNLYGYSVGVGLLNRKQRVVGLCTLNQVDP
jgi:hypothetical protein